MTTEAATRPPRSAAARRAAGEPDPPSVTEGSEAPPVEAGDGGDLQAQLAQAEMARAQAEEDARLAREELEVMREQQEAIAAGAAPDLPATVTDAIAPGPAPSAGQALPASAVPAPPLPDGISAEDLRLLKRIKEGREIEILERLAAAPTKVGTDLDQYTLVHLRGCPQPGRTETYPATNSSTGERFTIHRCMECGAHLPIPH